MTSMADHLRAIASKLPTTTPADIFAPEPGRQPPFWSIEAPGWGADPDSALDNHAGAFQVDVRIRAVAGTPKGVGILLDQARASVPGRLTVAGRRAEVQWTRSEFIDLDRDSTIPATNRHPAVGVETYTLTSQPSKETP